MSTKRATDWREVRRRRAWDLKQKGWKQRDIATALGVTEGAVSQWLKRGREQGDQALAARKHPGRRAQLSPQQRQQIPALLAKGAEAYGFRGNLWNRRRVAAGCYVNSA
jgi:transposase